MGVESGPEEEWEARGGTGLGFHFLVSIVVVFINL